MLAHICDATAEEDASDEKDGEYEACGQLAAIGMVCVRQQWEYERDWRLRE